MDAVDDALSGRSPMPYELRKFLLATGERGLGYAAVFGSQRLTVQEFETYSWIQQRVLAFQNDDDRNGIQRESAMRYALRLEEHEQEIAAAYNEPVDFMTMTPEQMQAWLDKQPKM